MNIYPSRVRTYIFTLHAPLDAGINFVRRNSVSNHQLEKSNTRTSDPEVRAARAQENLSQLKSYYVRTLDINTVTN